MSNNPGIYPILLLPAQNTTLPDLSPKISTSGMGDVCCGVSEKDFLGYLNYYFKDWVYPQQQVIVPGQERPFVVDYLIREPTTNLHIDVELDEPMARDGTLIHFAGKDDRRNRFFVEAGWVVIRFCEEQVVSQPHRCCRFIGNVLAHITQQSAIAEPFSHIPPLTPVQQWSKSRAKSLRRQGYRQGYLSH